MFKVVRRPMVVEAKQEAKKVEKKEEEQVDNGRMDASASSEATVTVILFTKLSTTLFR